MDGVKGFLSGFFCLLLVSVLSLLGLTITLNLTVLNPDFVVAELRQLDIYSLLVGQLGSFLLRQGISAGGAEAALSGLEPKLEEEIEDIVRSIYSSIDRGEIGAAISLSGIKETMKDYIARVVSSSSELQGAPGGDMEAVISRIYSEVDGMMPETILLGDSILGAGAIPQINLIMQVPGYLKVAQRVLVVPAVLLLLLICLVYWWQPKPIARAVGVTFITVGVGCIIGSLFGSLSDVLFGFFSMPPDTYSQLYSGLAQLFNDILEPMRMYGFGFAGAGICLIIVSVLWRTMPTASHAMTNAGDGLA